MEMDARVFRIPQSEGFVINLLTQLFGSERVLDLVLGTDPCIGDLSACIEDKAHL